MITRTYRKAAAVLAVFESMYDDEEKTVFYVDTYKNGRENGFALKRSYGSNRKKAFFCEHRRSDSIVVYIDENHEDMITDEAYKNAKFFGPDEYALAAEYIWEQLTKNG